MDPKVEKLLEGKSDEEKFLAIAYSFGCLLTRPQVNSQCDSPMKDEPVAKKKVNREPKYCFDEVSDEEDCSDEPVGKKKINREPKYSFGEVSAEEDSSEQKSAKGNARDFKTKPALGSESQKASST